MTVAVDHHTHAHTHTNILVSSTQKPLVFDCIKENSCMFLHVSIKSRIFGFGFLVPDGWSCFRMQTFPSVRKMEAEVVQMVCDLFVSA